MKRTALFLLLALSAMSACGDAAGDSTTGDLTAVGDTETTLTTETDTGPTVSDDGSTGTSGDTTGSAGFCDTSDAPPGYYFGSCGSVDDCKLIENGVDGCVNQFMFGDAAACIKQWEGPYARVCDYLWSCESTTDCATRWGDATGSVRCVEDPVVRLVERTTANRCAVACLDDAFCEENSGLGCRTFRVLGPITSIGAAGEPAAGVKYKICAGKCTPSEVMFEGEPCTPGAITIIEEPVTGTDRAQ